MGCPVHAAGSMFNIFTCGPVMKWQEITYEASKERQDHFKELVENLKTSVKQGKSDEIQYREICNAWL